MAKSKKVTPTPPKRRARSRADSGAASVPASSSEQDDDRATITPEVENAPPMPPAVNRIINHTARRARSAPIVGGELPDAYIVDFMINFLADHRSDTGAERIPCGEVTGVDGITEEIQARFVPKLGPGYYRITPRINGKITKGQWVEYVSALGYIENDLDSDEIEFDDEDIGDDPAISPEAQAKLIRLQERLKYEEKLREAQTRNGHSPLTDKLLERVADQMLKPPADPVQNAVATLEAVQKINAFTTPKREANPAPAPQPPVDPKVTALKIIAENPNMIEIAKDVFGLKRQSDSDPWADAFTKLIDSGQLTPLVQAGASILGNIFQAILPRPAQAPDPQQPAPAPQPTQTPQQVASETPQALPASEQQSQTEAAQPEQAQQITPADELIYALIGLMEKQSPTAEAQNVININVVRHPELGDSIDELLNLSVDQILMLLSAYHPPVAQMSHAREWLESLIEALTAEGEETEEAGDSPVSVIH